MTDRIRREDAADEGAQSNSITDAGPSTRRAARNPGCRRLATVLPPPPLSFGTRATSPSSSRPPRARGEDHAGSSSPQRWARAAGRYIGVTVDGRYVVERIIGQGGMGTVYQVRRTVINKVFAMKVLNPTVARRQDITDRLVAEARAASWIGSPHIVEVVDIGHMPDGAAYIVMEYLDGESLKQLIRRGSLGLKRTLTIARQLAEGLAAAHAAGIVHRDLKPDNVLVTRLKGADFVKLLDFGVAKFEQIESRITAQGSVCGTPHYMSPEQATGDMVDHRSDVYSLGVMLYELVCGELPFSGDTPYRLMEQHVTAIPVAPSQRRRVGESIPAAVDAIVLKCLAKRREHRYASMRALAEDIAAAELGLEPRALLDVPSLPNLSSPSQEDVPTLLDAPHPRLRRSSSVRPPRVRREATTWDESTTRALVGHASVRSSSPLWVTVAGTLVGGLVVASSLMLFAYHERAQSRPGTTHAALVSAADSMRSGTDLVEVEVLVSPLDARIYAGGELLGRMPVRLQIRPDSRLELEIRREGFLSRRVVVDGKQPRVELTLTPAHTDGCSPTP